MKFFRLKYQFPLIVVCLFALFFACSKAPYISPEWQPFWELSRIESQTNIKSEDFPDSISLTFLWDYEEVLTADKISIKEEIIGEIYNIKDIRLERFGLEAGASVVFLVDESGSMRFYYQRMDSMMFALMEQLPADSFSVARFGYDCVAMERFYTQSDIKRAINAFDRRAYPDGTYLLPALEKAADMLESHKTSQKVIVLITDDDGFNDERYVVSIFNLINHLKQCGINVVVFSTGAIGHPLLKSLSYSTGGVYVNDIFSRWETDYLLSLIRHSYTAFYKPKRKFFDGQTRQVIVDFNDFPVKRYGTYKVAGELLPEHIRESIEEMVHLEEQEQEPQKERLEQFEYPKDLLMGLRVPFNEIGSNRLSPTARAVLDSFVTVVNSLPNEYARGMFEIKGYTCDIGDFDINFALSKRRAFSVKEYLERNITTGSFRFDSEGFGMANPIRANDTEAARRLNRRVEIEFTPEAMRDYSGNGGFSEVSDTLELEWEN